MFRKNTTVFCNTLGQIGSRLVKARLQKYSNRLSCIGTSVRYLDKNRYLCNNTYDNTFKGTQK